MDNLSPTPYLGFTLILSMLALLALAVESFIPLDPETKMILIYTDFGVCFLFMIDFLISLVCAENKLRYFMKWGWLDFLSSIPTIEALRWGRTARILRVLRVLRGIKSAKILSQFLVERRAEGAALAASLITIVLIVVSSISILQFETAPESNIKTAEDALWWAMTTVTTVGYGDRFPVTTEGRVLAVLLMVTGVGLFGTFSGFVASWFLKPSEDHTHTDLQLLHAEIQQIRNILNNRVGGEAPIMVDPSTVGPKMDVTVLSNPF